MHLTKLTASSRDNLSEYLVGYPPRGRSKRSTGRVEDRQLWLSSSLLASQSPISLPRAYSPLPVRHANSNVLVPLFG